MKDNKNQKKIKFHSTSGKCSSVPFTITDEGFISILNNGEEYLFSKSGVPINIAVDGSNNLPYIEIDKELKNNNCVSTKVNNKKKLNNYKNATLDQPWDNIFALKTLTIGEWRALLDILIENNLQDKKIHLKYIGESNIITNETKNKIKEIFLNSKNGIKKGRTDV